MMRHLSPIEIEALTEDENAAAAAQEHLSQCVLCQERLADAQRLERALGQLERVPPAPDLPARIIAALPPEAKYTRPASNPLLGAVTMLAALLAFALAYQTAFDLRANGAFDLVSYYAAQPQIVAQYPNQAWDTLAAAIPWLTLAAGFGVMALALGLMYRWTGRASRHLGARAG